MAKMLQEGKTPADIIRELYLRCFFRVPTEKELQSLQALVAEQQNPQKLLRHFLVDAEFSENFCSTISSVACLTVLLERRQTGRRIQSEISVKPGNL